MLARAQSLYLFIAALLAFSSLLFPFWYYMAGTAYLLTDFTPFSSAGIVHITGIYVSSILSPISGILSIAAIFLYKNRSLQSTLISVLIVIFLADVLSGLTAAHFMNEYLSQEAGTAVEHQPGAGLFVLLPQPLLFWLAMRGVKKDEKIVNAYKRL